MKEEDRRAFVAFVDARAARLHRYAYLLAGDRHLAEDLLQEALTKTYVAWPRLRETASAYTRRVLTTTAISWWRRRSWASEKPRDDVPERASGDGVEERTERDLMARRLAALPPRQRAAIVLRYYEDLDLRATAEAMGCSVGGVKSQVSRGLARLREHMQDGGADDGARLARIDATGGVR